MSGVWTYELLVKGPRERLVETLAGWGESLGADRYKLARANALGWVGPGAAVLSIGSDAPLDEAESLLADVARLARSQGFELSDGQGVVPEAATQVLLARFRQPPAPSGAGLPVSPATQEVLREISTIRKRELLEGVVIGITDDPLFFKKSPWGSLAAVLLAVGVAVVLYFTFKH